MVVIPAEATVEAVKVVKKPGRRFEETRRDRGMAVRDFREAARTRPSVTDSLTSDGVSTAVF